MEFYNKFEKMIYVDALAIILKHLRIPFEIIDNNNLKFSIHVIRDLDVDTTNMSTADVDNIIKIILTK